MQNDLLMVLQAHFDESMQALGGIVFSGFLGVCCKKLG
jgi:hypothetical protein